MQKVSSGSTWWHKKAFPTFWFGFLGIMMVIMLPSVLQQQAPAPVLLAPLGMAVVGYFLMRSLVWPLADEVYLDGDDVIVRNKGEEDRFPFSNVINVQGSQFTNPESITLNLQQPCLFGDEIKFISGPRSGIRKDAGSRTWCWGRGDRTTRTRIEMPRLMMLGRTTGIATTVDRS